MTFFGIEDNAGISYVRAGLLTYRTSEGLNLEESLEGRLLWVKLCLPIGHVKNTKLWYLQIKPYLGRVFTDIIILG